jgi:glucose 1-dehydrogenase
MVKIFKDHTVLISGGLGDIGRAIAIEFAGQGANIALCDLRSKEEATEFLDELKKNNISHSYNQVDVSDASAVMAWVDEVEKYQGLADIVIVNAAQVTLAGILEISPEQWSSDLRVNLDGAFHLSQYATAKLIQHKKAGRVVFIGSWAGYTPHIHIPAYCVSKAGLRMLCKCMALEMAKYDILVNEIAPGYVAAGLSGNIWKENPGQAERSRMKVPIQKVISPEEVAQQVTRVCYPDNIHMTGSTILMDGGLSLLS